MEYDNDRVVKGVHKTEVYCWVFFVLLNPVVNSLGIFPHQQTAWVALILASLFISPLYISYSRVIVPKFLYTGKHFLFGFLTILFFPVVIGLVFLMNGIMLYFVQGVGQYYFAFSTVNLAREGSWVFINSFLAVSIAAARSTRTY